jgi:hypothetical protein
MLIAQLSIAHPQATFSARAPAWARCMNPAWSSERRAAMLLAQRCAIACMAPLCCNGARPCTRRKELTVSASAPEPQATAMADAARKIRARRV